MSVDKLALQDALTPIGKAVPLVGDWTTAGGLIALGATEGPIVETGGWDINGLTAPEHTGGILHAATVTPGALSVSIPTILGDPDIFAKINPHGSKSGVGDNPSPVVTTGLWLVPLACFPESGGIGYNGTAWTPAGIELTDLFLMSVLFGKGFLTHGDIPHPFENGGKAITTVTFTPMYDSRLPAGKKVWLRGNPVAEGLTLFRA